jgi:hypothetical protein
MGIGRREFLKFVAAALGGVAVDPIRMIAVKGDYYVNAKLGLGFIKPSEWEFEAFQDFATKLEGQIVQGLPPEVDEEEFRRDQASTLVATICKYGEKTRKFGPSITVFKNQEDYASLGSASLDEVARDGIDGFAGLVKDYEVIEQPGWREISRCASIRFKSRWLFEHREIEPILIDDETLIIDQGSLLYTIHLYDSPSVGDTAPSEFARFLRRLHIA